ncbi:CD59 glycoprotein [Chanos chanos]|uniref:MAC-inhibitory protein n=1 Tax=Chanos chanos TaxID=29144 RepID=A0A6J2UT36_CHACN|nr:CD59 glycoprotein [Chanos chanos]
MKKFLGVSLVCLALCGLGAAIQCYSCSDYTGSCTKTVDCSLDDACLTLKERGGDTHRKCVKYSDCSFKTMSIQFPRVQQFTFDCCTTDLCNAASFTAVSKPVLAVLSSLALLWCCLL